MEERLSNKEVGKLYNLVTKLDSAYSHDSVDQIIKAAADNEEMKGSLKEFERLLTKLKPKLDE